jgi:single-strand DNA-binding protein
VNGRPSEVTGQYLKKGREVFIEGRLQLQTWDDKQTGQKRSKLNIVGENLQLLGGIPEGSQPAQPPPRQAAFGGRPAPQRDPDLDQEPDDIPF